MKEQKENGVVVNIPFQLKEQIDSEFAEYTQKNLDKIYFIVYKICKEVNYQFNIKNHSEFFGLKNGEVTDILSRLNTMLIIATDGNYKEGSLSNSYRLIKPYNCIDKKNYRKFYYKSYTDLPLWIQKYIADGYTVVGKKFSKFIKIKSLTDSEMDNEIKRLQALLTANGIDYSSDKNNSLEAIKLSEFIPPVQNQLRKNNKPKSAPLITSNISDVKEPVNEKIIHSKPLFVNTVKEQPLPVTGTEEYIIDANTSVTNPSMLYNYFKSCKVDSTELINQLIVGAAIRDYVIINDFRNKKTIKGSKIKQDNKILFTVSEIL